MKNLEDVVKELKVEVKKKHHIMRDGRLKKQDVSLIVQEGSFDEIMGCSTATISLKWFGEWHIMFGRTQSVEIQINDVELSIKQACEYARLIKADLKEFHNVHVPIHFMEWIDPNAPLMF